MREVFNTTPHRFHTLEAAQAYYEACELAGERWQTISAYKYGAIIPFWQKPNGGLCCTKEYLEAPYEIVYFIDGPSLPADMGRIIVAIRPNSETQVASLFVQAADYEI